MEKDLTYITALSQTHISGIPGLEELGIDTQKLYKLLGNMFCPGHFYYIIKDTRLRDFAYVAPQISKVLPIRAEEASFESLMKRIHSADKAHIACCEQLKETFYYDFLPTELLTHYKVSYSFRIRTGKGIFILLHHQEVPLRLDEKNRIQVSLIIHSSLSHLGFSINRKISFMSLGKGKHFLGMDPTKQHPNSSHSGKNPLTRKQIEVLKCLSEGKNLKKIAEDLRISPHTARTHRNNIRKKLNCRNTRHAIALACREGWI
ncbi:MAG: helix-turn-helix transcriptional regulator [Bacteroidota bacterium]